jgi:hypothetical protein
MPRYRLARIASGRVSEKQGRHGKKNSESPASDQQIDDQHDQQNTADPDAAAISPPGITKTAPEDKKKHNNNEDQVHPVSPLKFSFLVEIF